MSAAAHLGDESCSPYRASIPSKAAPSLLREVLERLPPERWRIDVVALPVADAPTGRGCRQPVGEAGGDPPAWVRSTSYHPRTHSVPCTGWNPDSSSHLNWAHRRLAGQSPPMARRCPFVIRLAGGTPGGSEFTSAQGRVCHERGSGYSFAAADAVVSPARHLLEQPGGARPEIRRRGRLLANGGPAPNLEAIEPEANIDVVWVGRDAPVKGSNVLLQIATECPSLRFVAVGVERWTVLPPTCGVSGDWPMCAQSSQALGSF